MQEDEKNTIEQDELFDFIPIYNPKFPEKDSSRDRYIRVPNALILDNPTKTCHVNRVFLVVFCLISLHITYENESFLSIQEVFDSCHYSCSRKRPKMFNEVIKSLYFLEKSNFILLSFPDLTDIDYTDLISMRVNADLFMSPDHFTILKKKDFLSIIQPDSEQTKENLLHSFLYICAHMRRQRDRYLEKPDYYSRKKKTVQEMLFQDASEYSDFSQPEAYWGSIDTACSELSISKRTFTGCLSYLCSLDHPLLVKRSLGYIQHDGQPTSKKYPTIYVLNKIGCEAELNKAEKIIKQYEEENYAEKENEKN